MRPGHFFSLPPFSILEERRKEETFLFFLPLGDGEEEKRSLRKRERERKIVW